MAKDTALLLIDVQVGLMNKKTPVYRQEEVLGNINALADRARSAGVPVYLIQHAGESVLKEGTEDWQFHPGLRRQPTDIVMPKHHPNGFLGTTLADDLKKRGISRVVAAGFVTHGCVKSTCQGALELGYRTVLAGDAHSSYNKDAKALIDQWNTKLAEEGAEVKPAASIEF